MYRSQLKITTQETQDNGSEHKTDAAHAPIKALTLRDNQLHGSILVGNYHYLTHLEVSDNEIESLDLTTLTNLETLKCNHNRLMELVLCGERLTNVSLQCNNLHTLNVLATPQKLTHFNVSHNCFSQLPHWLSSCEELQLLNANNNNLQNINDFLANYSINNLQQLHLAFNQLQTLGNKLPEKLTTLKEFYAQANNLQKLPENFFEVTHARLVSCNLSSNKLSTLPKQHVASSMCLEQLLLSNNRLTERIFDAALLQMFKLRVLHLAYNKIAVLPEHCLTKFSNLEVLILSGNMLQQLPAGITKLSKLQVLRVHSNLLLKTPSLCKLTHLKVLDLAHNHLDHINLLNLVPAQLKYLDLSCNLQLQVDEQEMLECQHQRKMSLIDVSGKNRPALPTVKLDIIENFNGKQAQAHKPPWVVGFSETPGLRCRKLLISQLRLSNFLNNAALFGMFECVGGISASNMSAQIRQVPQILQQQLQQSLPTLDCLKETLIKICEKLSTNVAVDEEKTNYNISGIICHLAKEHMQNSGKSLKSKTRSKHYVLRLVSVGKMRAYLVRKTSNICISSTPQCQHVLCQEAKTTTATTTTTTTDKSYTSKQMILSNEDEYLVMCNSSLWQVMSIERVASEIRKEENMLLAAKRVQNIAQSFGAQESLSVLVLRFKNLGTDVEYLLRELKEMSRNKTTVNCFPRKQPLCVAATCCNDRLVADKCQTALRSYTRSERSSPSGQSDHLTGTKLDGKEYASLAHVEEVLSEECDALDETESMLSEEQFKCWEYMLEQNTQLLFDKELNTISKAFTHNNKDANKYVMQSNDELHVLEDKLSSKKFATSSYNTIKSASSPHLMYGQADILPSSVYQLPSAYQQHLSFLPKPLSRNSRAISSSGGYNYLKNRLQDSFNMSSFVGSSYTKLAGGPNAAYFGSVQRALPLNYEYDLAAVTQECSMLDDEDNFSDEHVSRMSKYWGVATTEL